MKRHYPRLLILDFDGTVGDTRSIITDTMMQTIDELQLEKHTRAECAKMIGLPLKACFSELIPMNDEMADRCEQTYRRIFTEKNAKGVVALFPHVADTLRHFHEQGTTITLASSRNHSSLAAYVDWLGLSRYISYILGADDVEQAKPAPEAVTKTLHRFHRQPGEALVVGDTKFDILMGVHAQTPTCGVTYGNGTREELQAAGAQFIIDDFSALKTLPL